MVQDISHITYKKENHRKTEEDIMDLENIEEEKRKRNERYRRVFEQLVWCAGKIPFIADKGQREWLKGKHRELLKEKFQLEKLGAK